VVTGMTAVAIDASRAANPALGGPVPARTGGPAAADRSPAVARPGRAIRSWPLLVLAAPAAAEVFSGWVGIAQKTGFGLVSPLPGIWPALHLDTAITLPVGVETYAAYALRAWLARDQIVSDQTRRFAKCGTVQPLIGRDDGAGVCGPCAGHAAAYTCSQCGRHGNPHSRGRCAHCVLAERVAGLLAGPDGTIAPQLEPLAAALAAAPSPFPAIQWIKESPNTRLLARLTAEGRTLSHELLDELPPTRNQRYIRQVLVHTGVLAERNEDIERIPGWLEHELAGKPATHASLARPFLHWFLLRRARQRADRRRYPASADRDLRRRVSVALEFLAWADERGITLADLTQEHIDDWIAGARSQRRYLIRYFLTWTTSRRLTQSLAVPAIPRQEPQTLLGEDDRWQLLQRCLTDDTMPVDVRAGGAITLLFGPSAERLCRLTPDHLKPGGKHDRLVLGRHPVLLPPRLAAILRHLAEQPSPRPQLSRSSPGPRWLFPGMVPGKPISTHGMTQKLGRHGISVRAGRNSALAALAADLPSPILADLTGMHRHTALRWVAYARSHWADYLAARAADQDQARQPEGTLWLTLGSLVE